jgi:AMP deaminase
MAQMRKIFLKTDNHIEGRYFAELTKIVLARHEQSKGHKSGAEMRLSIYGMERNEWLHLAKWVLRDWQTGDFPGNMLSSHNRWLVQVPRLWRVYHKKGKGTVSFQDMLENLFAPLFEATLFPDEHPEVAELLKHIVGFDSVDDEGSLEVGNSVRLNIFTFVCDLLLTSSLLLTMISKRLHCHAAYPPYGKKMTTLHIVGR